MNQKLIDPSAEVDTSIIVVGRVQLPLKINKGVGDPNTKMTTQIHAYTDLPVRLQLAIVKQ